MNAKREDAGIRIFDGNWSVTITTVTMVKELNRLTTELIKELEL